MIEIPALLHVDDTYAATISTSTLPGIMGINAVWSSVKEPLISTPWIPVGIHGWWAFKERVNALNILRTIVKLVY